MTKKIAQAAITLLTLLFLSIGSVTTAQDVSSGGGGQGSGDVDNPNCIPTRTCRPLPECTPHNCPAATPSVGSQGGTVAPGGVMNVLDLVLLFIQLKLGL